MSRLVFDASPLSHFARAEKLEALQQIASSHECFVTQTVIGELERGIAAHPALARIHGLSWLEVVHVDGLLELQAFADYARRLGSGARDLGEATTLAWAECNDAVAVVDERAGTRHGLERDVEVHGTLWLIALGVRRDALSHHAAEVLVQALGDAEAWFPSFEGSFIDWARENELLE